MEEARRRGFTIGVVERYIHARRIRMDYLGVIDLIAISPVNTIGIQACSGCDHAKHRTKLLESIYTAIWLESPHRKLAIWSWRKKKIKRGGVAYRWHLREDEITLVEALEAIDGTEAWGKYLKALDETRSSVDELEESQAS